MRTEAARPGFFPFLGNDLSDWIHWGVGELSFLAEPEARRDCEWLLEGLFGISRSEIYLGVPSLSFNFSEFFECIQARKKRIPTAYLLKQTPFWDESLEVEEGVLIPRPETERLVEIFSGEQRDSRNNAFYFLDLGTGSGNIAVTMAKLFPYSRGIATDLSPLPLSVARRNAERLGVSRQLRFLLADGMTAFQKERFDCILANPPYIASKDREFLDPEVQREPRLALDGGEDGLDFYRKIFREILCLKKGGTLWMEIGWGQKEAVCSLFEEAGFREIRVWKDYCQIERVIGGIRYQVGNHG